MRFSNYAIQLQQIQGTFTFKKQNVRQTTYRNNSSKTGRTNPDRYLESNKQHSNYTKIELNDLRIFCIAFKLCTALYSAASTGSRLPSPVQLAITLNVRSVRNRVKRKSIFSYLKDQNCHFYLLQETFSEPKDELVWKNEWGVDVFFSHGSTTHSKGVCILVNPSVVVNEENSYKDIDG